MYSEDLEKEELQRLKKDLEYNKWLLRNISATENQKKIARDAHALVDTFNLPDITDSWWSVTDEEIDQLCTVENFHKWLKI